MTLPEPKLAGQVERVDSGGVEEVFCGEGHGCGVEEAAAESDEGDDQDDLQRVGEVVGDLRGGDVEPEDEGYGEAEDGGGAEEGIEADEESGGKAPGEFLRGGSASKESEDGKSDAAVGPAVLRECLLQRHL